MICMSRGGSWRFPGGSGREPNAEEQEQEEQQEKTCPDSAYAARAPPHLSCLWQSPSRLGIASDITPKLRFKNN